MNKLRTLFDDDIPLVAVSFRDGDSERLADEAKLAGVDVAELRIDKFSRTDADHVLAQLRSFRELPTLATVRTRQEGGEWGGTEAERLDLFRAVAAQVEAVDIELSSREILPDVVSAARRHDAMVIVSYHNFERTPGVEELDAVVDDARQAGADVVKVSTMATSNEDLRRLALLLLRKGRASRLIVIAMGSIGSASRVFFPALGSRLTYSFIGNGFAAGQLEYSETFHLLRRFYPEFNERKIADMELLENV